MTKKGFKEIAHRHPVGVLRAFCSLMLLTLLGVCGYMGASHPAKMKTVSLPIARETISGKAIGGASIEEVREELEKQRIEEEQRAIKKIEEERRRKKSIKTFAIIASALVIIFGGYAIYKAVTPPTKEEQVSMDLEKFSDNGVLTEDLAKNHKSEIEKKAEEIKNSDYDTYCYIQAQLSLYADDNGFVAIKYLQQIKHTERFSDYNKIYDLCKDNM